MHEIRVDERESDTRETEHMHLQIERVPNFNPLLRRRSHIEKEMVTFDSWLREIESFNPWLREIEIDEEN